ncbi:MAG: ABC transporter substrate-binding protein [Gammaproteobacteria bacterium]|nr:ABC transporter substrate-binding protein [Gammaproteobacteria bacterium]
MSTALSGPSQTLGQEVKRGINVYFSKVNANGGVDGRKLILIALDDQYEPHQTGINMRHLADNHQVLAVIGNVGTPTAEISVPIANEKKLLLFGAFSGAQVLHKIPPNRYVINFRSSYESEMQEIIQGLLSIDIKPEEIAFLLQNDAYGMAGYQGAISALKRAGFDNTEKLPITRYTRNTLNVENAVANMMDASIVPKAIIMIGVHSPIAKFIKLASKEFPDAIFLNVSFVGSTALARDLAGTNEKVIVTQVMPDLDAPLPAIDEYRKDLKKYGDGANPDYISLEGYLCAKLFVMGLYLASEKNALTREGIIDAFEKMRNVDIGIDEKIYFDKNDHEALKTVRPTILKNGNFIPLKWADLIQRK